MSTNIIMQCFYYWLVLVGSAALSYISELCKANLVCIIHKYLTILKQTPEKRQTFVRFMEYVCCAVYNLCNSFSSHILVYKNNQHISIIRLMHKAVKAFLSCGINKRSSIFGGVA